MWRHCNVERFLLRSKMRNKRGLKYRQFDEIVVFFSTNIIWRTSGEIIDENSSNYRYSRFIDIDTFIN